MQSEYDKKQICYSIECDLKDKQEELYEAVKQLLPEGNIVQVKRGNGIWEVEVTGHHKNQSAGEFIGKSVNGKFHHFNWKDVIL